VRIFDFRFSIFDCSKSLRGLVRFGALAVVVILTLALCTFSWVLVAGLGGGGAGKMPAPQKGAWVSIGSQGEALGQFKQPRGISAFSDGSFVVADRAARVQFFARNGTPLRVWTMKEHSCGNPKGLCTLPDGNVLVCDTHYGRVLVMTPFGEIVKTWGTYGYGPGQFIHPLSAAVDAARGVAYIVEYGDRNDRVQKFALDGQFLKCWGSFGQDDGQFLRPSGVAVDAEGSVYVADACNHRIQAFDGEGRFLRSFGRMGKGAGELSYPYDIACGPDGLLYVAEFNNHRVSVFERGGKFVRTYGGPGSALGQFANPWSLTVDASGRLLVSDTRNNRVEVVDLGQKRADRD
jgi:DNA-binding beta-propeller fold protein YncE